MNSIRSRRGVGSSPFSAKSPPPARGRPTQEARPQSLVRLKSQEKAKANNQAEETYIAAPAGTVEDSQIPEGNIRVCVRVRPLNNTERQSPGNDSCINVLNNHSIQLRQTTQDHTGLSQRTLPTLSFDLTAPPEMGQEEFFNSCGVTELVDASLQGFASTVFAYGQTGSGKTFTMSGNEQKDGSINNENMGLMPRTFAYLGQKIAAMEAETPGKRFVLRASYMELYNEQIKDLISPGSTDLSLRQKQHGSNTDFFVEGLSVVQCSSIDDLAAVAREGHQNRHVAAHNLNQHSSRSHSIFSVYIECRQVEQGDDASQVLQWVRYGKLTFVDLAGSENLRTSGIFSNNDGMGGPTDKQKASGAAHMKETAAINRSLFALGAVMSILSAVNTGRKPKNTFIPYRNSKLTMILQDSLGGSALTMMLACVSPAASCAEESRRTLTYAATCKNIANKPQVAVDPRTALLLKYKEQARILQDENTLLKSYIVSQGLPVPEFDDDEPYTAPMSFMSAADYAKSNSVNDPSGTPLAHIPGREGAYSALGRQGAVSVEEASGAVTGVSHGTCAGCATYIPPSLEVLRENAKLRVRMQQIVDVLVRLGAADLVGLSREDQEIANAVGGLKGALGNLGEGQKPELYVYEEEIRDLDWDFAPENKARPATQRLNRRKVPLLGTDGTTANTAFNSSGDGDDSKPRDNLRESFTARASSANEATILSATPARGRPHVSAAQSPVVTGPMHDKAAGGPMGEDGKPAAYMLRNRRASLSLPPNELEQTVAKLQMRETELKKTMKELEQRVLLLQEQVMESANDGRRGRTRGKVLKLKTYPEDTESDVQSDDGLGTNSDLRSDAAPVVMDLHPPPRKQAREKPTDVVDNNQYDFDSSIEDILGLTPPTKSRSISSDPSVRSDGDLGRILSSRVADAVSHGLTDPLASHDSPQNKDNNK